MPSDQPCPWCGKVVAVVHIPNDEQQRLETHGDFKDRLCDGSLMPLNPQIPEGHADATD